MDENNNNKRRIWRHESDPKIPQKHKNTKKKKIERKRKRKVEAMQESKAR